MAEMGKKIGSMPCPEHPTVTLLVRQNEKGTFAARCDECDDTHYARKGTGKHAAWQKKITLTAAPATEPKKDEKKPGTGFVL